MHLTLWTCQVICLSIALFPVCAVAGDKSDEDLQMLREGLRTLAQSPDDQQARAEIFEATRDLGLFEWASKFGPFDNRQLDRHIEGDRLALEIRYGIVDRDTLCGPHRFDRLDDALASTDQLERTFLVGYSPDQEDLRRLGDRIIALHERHRDGDAVRLYETMRQRDLRIPSWTLREVAGSYLNVRRPAEAVALYQTVLSEHPEDFEAHVGLVYALLDMHDAPSAIDTIDAYAAGLPEHRRLDGKYNGERSAADILSDRARMDANRLDEAQQRLAARLSEAPSNGEVRRAMASLALARGWPRDAQQRLQGVTAMAPCDADAFAELSEAALITQDWGRARQALQVAETLDPYTSAVRRADTSMALHDRYELRVDVNYEHSQANNSHASDYFGNDDWNADTTLYGPPMGEYWRWYAHNYIALADFSDSWVRWNRTGAGVEWRWLNWRLAAELNGGNVGGTGGNASLRWAPDDHWSIDASANYRTNDIPLKAVAEGIYANDVSLGIHWRLNESLGLSAVSTRTNFTDSNKRTAWSVQWEQRWVSEARWTVETLLASSGSTNTLTTAASYFNPRHDHDVLLTGIAEHVSWMDYNYRFTQRVELGVGRYWQADYSPGNMTYLRYGHAWDLGGPVEWHYGVAVVRRPYDGVQETQLRADIHLLWRF